MDTNEMLKAKIADLETALADYMQRYGATELARSAMFMPKRGAAIVTRQKNAVPAADTGAGQKPA